MDKIKIDKIIVKDNVRTDYGNIEELAASILESGLRDPLELKKDNELIDGFRRFRAIEYINSRKDIPADKKIKEVKFFYSDEKIDKATSQIIAGIHQKNLTPLEEAKAFRKYINKTKSSEESLAKKLGKKPDYIARRLLLLNLCEPVEKALQDRKIEVGHGQLLSQMNEKQQKNALKEILEWDLTVQNFADQIRWMKKIDFGNIEFRSSKDNSQKTIFGSVGKELNPKHDKADFKDSPAFRKDLTQYVESERKVLKNKGIKIFKSKEGLEKKFPEAEEVNSWDDGYTKVLKELSGSKKYAVVVDMDYNGLSKEVYLLDPKAEKEKEQEAKKAKQKQLSPEEKAEAEKNLNLSRKEKLKRRVCEFERDFLIDNSRNLLEPGFITKALVLWQLMSNNYSNEFTEKALAFTGISGNDNRMDNILKLPEEKLDKALSIMAKITLAKLELPDLSCASHKIGVKYDKHFVMSEEYLKPYTKDALRKLGKELKISLDGIEKASNMKNIVVKNWETGQVPKALAA
jgi:ParB family transcriptional regulator, chromosome partitioning protein